MTEAEIKEWVATHETLEYYLQEDGLFGYQVLILTSHRAILLEKGFFGVKEKGDKLWGQFVSAQLEKRPLVDSTLTLNFFRRYVIKNPLIEALEHPWVIMVPARAPIADVYKFLKAKEQQTKAKFNQ